MAKDLLEAKVSKKRTSLFHWNFIPKIIMLIFEEINDGKGTEK